MADLQTSPTSTIPILPLDNACTTPLVPSTSGQRQKITPEQIPDGNLYTANSTQNVEHTVDEDAENPQRAKLVVVAITVTLSTILLGFVRGVPLLS